MTGRAVRIERRLNDMKQGESESAARLATTLLRKNLGELFATAASNPQLAEEWLGELVAAERLLRRQHELLSEAIEDVQAALVHARADRDNVVPLVVGWSQPRAAG